MLSYWVDGPSLPTWLGLLAHAVALQSAGYLLALGLVCWVRPIWGRRFLLAHASTPGRHALELGLRLAVGLAWLGHAPHAALPGAAAALGLVLLITTLGLALMPWQWHQAVAARTVPRALGHLGWIGLGAVVGGVALAALAWGPA